MKRLLKSENLYQIESQNNQLQKSTPQSTPEIVNSEEMTEMTVNKRLDEVGVITSEIEGEVCFSVSVCFV